MSFESQPLDEGYSEAPLSTGNSDGGNGSNSGQETLPVQELPSWIGTLSPQEQIAYVMNILNSIPTSQVSQIVERLRPRLFINFFQKLPPEVCLKILGYLDPVSLIHTALASSEWRRLAMDRKLWEHLYYLEGFRVLPTEVLDFENSLASRLQLGTTAAVFQQTSQRSPQPLQLDDDSEMIDADSTFVSRPPHISGQSSLFGPSGSRNQENQPPSIASFSHKPMGNARRQDSKEDAIMTDVSERRSRSGKAPAAWESDALAEVTKSRLVALDRSNMQEQPQPKLDWQRLYSLRRKLEANWEAEKYTNFQLPHPHYPADGHRECIYTIQYSGQFLVSGSRDKTLRVWDLNTQRLVYEPLKGHAGSVLCLQFDANRATDLIVSGSSDATICLWRFSTGKLIQRIRRAHHESVLNVRFDDNVLVTCSKDKTIKIFNRHPLLPGDAWYPRPAEAVNPVPTHLMNYGFNPTPTSGLPVKPPYSIIAVLEGHGAAVNAVQIFGNQVVSASGDRTIKVWDWPDQTCVRTLIGHTKGIACVQYDGRRIVSGSSDNEVKVFDKDSGLEVASLRAHSDLVRTVQAGFGDLPYSVEEDKEDAKLIDNEYFKAVDEGKVSRNMDLQRGRSRNAGSRRPEDITAYGAKLPPGGGGGKFGRIVSGSYDGTIIIWRRDKEGVWKAQHTLRQEDGALAAQRAQGNPPAAPATNLHQTPTIQLPAPIVPTTAVLQGANQPMNHAPAQAAIQAMQAMIQAGPAPAQQNTAPIAPPAALHHHHHHGHRAVENYRVFKLQFDARRIISCSQTPTIVGWDFANGDKEIIEASRFFAPIE